MSYLTQLNWNIMHEVYLLFHVAQHHPSRIPRNEKHSHIPYHRLPLPLEFGVHPHQLRFVSLLLLQGVY